jgi:hypothetical protein
MVDARMSVPSQYDADRTDEPTLDCASEPSFAAQLRKTLNTIPSYTWYAGPVPLSLSFRFLPPPDSCCARRSGTETAPHSALTF